MSPDHPRLATAVSLAPYLVRPLVPSAGPFLDRFPMPAKPTLDPRVDAYIEAAAPFAQPILEKIRAAFHAGAPDLKENIKWGVPSFEREGILGGMAVFKAHVSYGFWRAGEMEDPHDLLGEVRKASPMRIQAQSVKDLPSKTVLVSYVKQARQLDETPKKATKKARPSAKAPAYLTKAIRANAKAAAFWKTLAPGYRREYVEWITEAKRDATRDKRLEQTVLWLSENKRRNWKYENC